MMLEKEKFPYIYLNGDEPDVREMLPNATSTRLKSIVGNKKIVFIDEMQRIKNIGIILKLFADTIKNIQVIATRSSAIEIANNIKEPLTGRKYEFTLFPVSFEEMVNHHGLLEEKRMAMHRITFGYYPDIINHPGEEKELLKSLADSYLYKDVLSLGLIKKPAVLQKLLRALALQIGSEVSFNEMAQLIGADKETVERYIDLLQKSFVIFMLPAMSGNLRSEIKKGKKIYFYDNGIRNAVLSAFDFAENRTDLGYLFENFLISERYKFLNNHRVNAEMYFWRTVQQQEIDYVEKIDGRIFAYKFKLNKKKVKFSKTFKKAYPNASLKVITMENFDEFLTAI